MYYSLAQLYRHVLLVLKKQININLVIVGVSVLPFSPVDRISSLKKKKQRNTQIKWHYTSNEPNRYLQIIPCKHQRIHILLSILRSFFKGGHILEHKEFFLIKKIEYLCECYSTSMLYNLKLYLKGIFTQTHGD
jgi:hypothetical protein